ncbi:MAG: Crp/Fnr family transcriptional regulator [Rhizomicrobium sp.]|jgi:CRP-like cAMP-binding protein
MTVDSGSRISDKIAALSRSDLFGVLSEPALVRLAALAEWRLLAEDQVVFRRGDPGLHIFVIHRGRVKFGTGAADGREVTLNLLGPGAVFGEVGFADGGPRTADAVAAEPLELLALSRRTLVPFLKSEPEAMLQMMAALATRARWISESYEDQAFLELPARLAKRLLFLSRHFGYDTPRGRRLAASFTHRELANHMNVARESITRLIQKWRRDGLIDEHRGIMVLLDPARLQRLADTTEV